MLISKTTEQQQIYLGTKQRKLQVKNYKYL